MRTVLLMSEKDTNVSSIARASSTRLTVGMVLLSVCISSLGYTTSETPGRLFKAGT